LLKPLLFYHGDTIEIHKLDKLLIGGRYIYILHRVR